MENILGASPVEQQLKEIPNKEERAEPQQLGIEVY